MPWLPGENFRSPAALARFLLTVAIGVATDLWTKSYAFATLALHIQTLPGGRVEVDSRTFPWLPNWIHFHVTANQGAVFGMGQGQRWLFLTVSVLAIAFLSYLFATSNRHRLYQVILGMLLAGVLGNMYDRIVHGYVRDMIWALPGRRWGDWFTFLPESWAKADMFPWIFNVADVLLCTGVGLLLLHNLLTARATSPHATSNVAHPV